MAAFGRGRGLGLFGCGGDQQQHPVVLRCGFNNSSLMFLPLSTAQMIKSLHPAVLAVFLYYFEDKTYSWLKVVIILGLVIGVTLSVLGNQSATPAGVLLSLGSVSCTPFTRGSINHLTISYYDILFHFILCRYCVEQPTARCLVSTLAHVSI
jgi:drug/metabolite transporter (DMT)-like permease